MKNFSPAEGGQNSMSHLSKCRYLKIYNSKQIFGFENMLISCHVRWCFFR